MKVKIGNTIYDAEKEPILLILTDKDKELISNMGKEHKKYCAYPSVMPEETIIDFMETE